MSETKSNQRRAFIETARELGADETGETFERAFARIAPPRKPGEKAAKPDVPKKARKRSAEQD